MTVNVGMLPAVVNVGMRGHVDPLGCPVWRHRRRIGRLMMAKGRMRGDPSTGVLLLEGGMLLLEHVLQLILQLGVEGVGALKAHLAWRG